jgi:hypothetical protein
VPEVDFKFLHVEGRAPQVDAHRPEIAKPA